VKIARAALVLFAVGGIAATVSYAALPLTGRVLSSGELSGMKINGPNRVLTGAGARASSGAQRTSGQADGVLARAMKGPLRPHSAARIVSKKASARPA